MKQAVRETGRGLAAYQSPSAHFSLPRLLGSLSGASPDTPSDCARRGGANGQRQSLVAFPRRRHSGPGGGAPRLVVPGTPQQQQPYPSLLISPHLPLKLPLKLKLTGTAALYAPSTGGIDEPQISGVCWRAVGLITDFSRGQFHSLSRCVAAAPEIVLNHAIRRREWRRREASRQLRI